MCRVILSFFGRQYLLWTFNFIASPLRDLDYLVSFLMPKPNLPNIPDTILLKILVFQSYITTSIPSFLILYRQSIASYYSYTIQFPLPLYVW